MISPLIDYKISLENTVVSIEKIPLVIGEEIVDVVASMSASFTVAPTMDTDAISRGLLDQETAISTNSRGNRLYTIFIQAFWEDGKDFIGPVRAIDNRETFDIDENVLCQFILEDRGIVDHPDKTSSLDHFPIISKEYKLPNGKTITVSSQTPGVTKRLRSVDKYGEDGESIEVTFLVAQKDVPGWRMYSGLMLTYKRTTLGSSPTAKVFVTFAQPSNDTKPEIVN